MGDEDRDNERAGAFFWVMERRSACHVGHTMKGVTVDGLQGTRQEQVFGNDCQDFKAINAIRAASCSAAFLLFPFPTA